MNAYHVQLSKPIKMEPLGSHFSGKETCYVYAVASSFENALRAVEKKYPGCQIRGISQANYDGLPIVAGE